MIKKFEQYNIKDLVFYISDAGLGYNEYIILMKLNKSKLGYNYLIIDKHCRDGDAMEYRVGGTTDLEDYYVKEIGYNVKESPLSGTFLFEFFLSKNHWVHMGDDYGFFDESSK
jgi:hypothetical protein